MATLTESIRERFLAAITCECCNQRRWTWVDLERQIDDAQVSNELLSRFARGDAVSSNQLDVIDLWLRNQEQKDKA